MEKHKLNKLSLEKMKENLQKIKSGKQCLYCGRENGDHSEDDECLYEMSIQKYKKKEFYDGYFHYRK